eukprot:m.362309 g.362309  ORF g.362309 m.362309 type:complete len:344 (+) comp16649_c1_seq9:5068-6099(+)
MTRRIPLGISRALKGLDAVDDGSLFESYRGRSAVHYSVDRARPCNDDECDKLRSTLTSLKNEDNPHPVANFDLRDWEGNSPLHLAAWHGNFEGVEFLLDHAEVELHAKNKEEETPLYMAVHGNHQTVVEYLLHCENFDPTQENLDQLIRISDDPGVQTALRERWRPTSPVVDPIPDFDRQIPDVDVLISYATDVAPGDREGAVAMRRVAGTLEANGISVFHGEKVQPGDDWQVEWFGRILRCRVAIVMLSQSYFRSKSCSDELIALLKSNIKIIPVIVGSGVKKTMRKSFLGESPEQKMRANYIRARLTMNWLPAPQDNHGIFDDGMHSDTLIATIRNKIREP